MTERNLRMVAAGLLLAGAAALGLQVLISLTWVPGALPFVLVISGPQLVAGIWVLLRPGRRGAVRYLPAILLSIYVAYWNTAVIMEPATVPDVPQLVLITLFLLLAIQALFPILAAGTLVWAWRVSRRSARMAQAAEQR